jgi:hypothetical protein
MASTKRSALAPGCVVDLTVLSTEIFINYRSFEHQAASDEASGAELFKQQATGVKPRATSVKRQATGGKLQDARSFVKFNLIKSQSFLLLGARGLTRIKVFLGCFTWKAIWCGENIILLPLLTFNSIVKNV